MPDVIHVGNGFADSTWVSGLGAFWRLLRELIVSSSLRALPSLAYGLPSHLFICLSVCSSVALGIQPKALQALSKHTKTMVLFERSYHYIPQVGLEVTILVSQLPGYLHKSHRPPFMAFFY